MVLFSLAFFQYKTKADELKINNSPIYDSITGDPVASDHNISMTEEAKGTFKTYNIGNIKDGKLTIIFPDDIGDDYLIRPNEEIHYNITPDFKIGIFYMNNFYIKNGNGFYDHFLYANKDGSFTSSGIIYKYQKGWNLYHFGEAAKDIGELYKQGYKWYFTERQDVWWLEEE